MDTDAFRRAGHRLVDDLAALFEGLSDRPVAPNKSPEEVRAAMGASVSLPEEGVNAEQLLAEVTESLIEHSTYNGHPRFFGYITAGPAQLGVLADLLASGVNPNLGGWNLSPMASEMELQATRWMADLVGFPSGGHGILTSGGNVANMFGFWAARAAKAGWDVRNEGIAAEGAPRLRAYGSAEIHTWIQKAADLSGLGGSSVRLIPTDEDLRMDVGALRKAIDADLEAGDRPFLVIGTGGSVGTGAVDPLPELRTLCDEFDLWFHVDGAYGAFAAATPEAPDDLRALSLADSVAMDPHKWLYTPLEAGCVLVRDPEALRNAFSFRPSYLPDQGEEITNFFEHGIQNSRGFRALKVWMQLKGVGRAGYERMIGEDIRLARRFFDRAGAHPELELARHGLSIVVYRYVPEDLRDRREEPGVAEYLDVLNRDVRDRLEQEGRAFVSNFELEGRYHLRMCIVNFRTDAEDVDALVDITVEAGRTVDEAERPDSLRA